MSWNNAFHICKQQISIVRDTICRNKKRKRNDTLGSRDLSKSWGLQSLMDDEDWDSATSLLFVPQGESYEKQLFQNISEMVIPPLFTIFEMKKELCASSRALCLRLIEIGGANVVKRVHLTTRSSIVSMWTALHYACYNHGMANEKRSWLEIVKKMLEVGGKDLVLMACSCGTALHMALSRAPSAETGKLVHLLLTVGGETLVLTRDLCDRTALHYLCLTKSEHGPEIVHQLLTIGGKKLVYMTADDGLTALHCVPFSHLDKFTVKIVDHLLEFGGETLVMMKTQGVGWTLLHILCNHITKNNKTCKILSDIVCRLIDTGGKRLVLDYDEELMTALHYLCKKRGEHCPRILNRLLEVGGEELLSKIDGNGDTVLHTACKSGPHRRDLIYHLLDIGREKLLFIEQLDEPCLTAIEIEFSATDNIKEEIIDRFFEIGGGKTASLIENFQ